MNSTVNGSSCSISLNPTAQKIGETFANCLIVVVSLVGNSFIGIIVYKTQTLRKPVNYFIVNMAMSDLLFPIFLFPRDLTFFYVDYQWLISGPLGQALCKLVIFLVQTCMFVSIQSLLLIAVDRFGAAVFPLRSPLISSKLCPLLILATWIVAMAVNSPFLVAYKLVELPNEKLYCFLQWDEAFGESFSYENYFLVTLILFYYIPIAVLVILYSIIVIKLKKQKIPGEHSVSAEQQRAKRNRKVLTLAIAIVVGFVLCWLPYSADFLVTFFARDYSITVFIAFSNCAVNPCICFSFSANYRRGLKRLLK